MSGPVNYDDVVAQLENAGLIFDSIIMGKMQRCKVEGTRERKGWYALHEIIKDDGDSIIVGSYGVWQGANNNAQKIELSKQKLTSDQKSAIRTRLNEDRKKVEAARQREIQIASKQSNKTWLACSPVGDSDYLKRKGVGAHGVRFTESGSIVIPMQDNSGVIYGLQFILPSTHPRRKKTGRDKEFWPAGMGMRGCYHIIGGSPHGILLVAEGYATAATLHEATGHAVAVAFNANNLLPVAENLKKRFRNIKIVVCADDDYLTDGNPGVTSAQAAALAVGGVFVKPIFTIDRDGKKITDFNDLHLREGLHVVTAQIEASILSYGWASDALSRVIVQSGERGTSLKSLLNVEEAVERYSLIYGAGGTMFDHEESALIPKSDVLDICVDHAWREWKLHAERKVVRLSEVGFDPSNKDHNIKCNLFSGWPTVAKQGQCDVLLDLLRYLCSGEKILTNDKASKDGEEIFQWVLKWLAYPLQHHGAKMRTALIFHGPQGVGKNLFFEAYSAIYGKYGRIVGQAEIDDKFNDWASGKLFMIADEVMARQELYHQKNKIKSLITGETIRINPKNVAAHDERNHVNIAFISNENQPLVLEKDDRRFAVIWVPEKLPENVYADIAEEISNGGIAALHHYLLNLDLGDFNEHSKPPMTKSKQDLIDINLDSVQRFMSDWIEGDIELPIVPCHSDDLYLAYQQWSKKNGVGRPRELAQVIGTIVKMRGWHKERPRVYKNLNYSGDQRQISVISPPDELIDSEFSRGELTLSQWYTNTYLEFKSVLKGNSEPEND